MILYRTVASIPDISTRSSPPQYCASETVSGTDNASPVAGMLDVSPAAGTVNAPLVEVSLAAGGDVSLTTG